MVIPQQVLLANIKPFRSPLSFSCRQPGPAFSHSTRQDRLGNLQELSRQSGVSHLSTAFLPLGAGREDRPGCSHPRGALLRGDGFIFRKPVS